jgi:hypothetical protein
MVRGTEEGAPFEAVDLWSQTWGSHWRISSALCAKPFGGAVGLVSRLRARCMPTQGAGLVFRVLPVIPWK